MKATRLPPKAMAKKLVRVLRSQHPDYHHLKKVFQHTRALLAVVPSRQPKRLPELLTDAELVALYEAIWQTRQLSHLVLLKLRLFTGIRNTELVQLRLRISICRPVRCRLHRGRVRRIAPSCFRPVSGGSWPNIWNASEPRARDISESNRHRPYSTRRIRQLVKQYAVAEGIEKRIYPRLFRHQLITYLTRQGIISPKLHLLSGHATEQSLVVYRELALSDVAQEYEAAMRTFPVR